MRKIILDTLKLYNFTKRISITYDREILLIVQKIINYIYALPVHIYYSFNIITITLTVIYNAESNNPIYGFKTTRITISDTEHILSYTCALSKSKKKTCLQNTSPMWKTI